MSDHPLLNPLGSNPESIKIHLAHTVPCYIWLGEGRISIHANFLTVRCNLFGAAHENSFGKHMSSLGSTAVLIIEQHASQNFLAHGVENYLVPLLNFSSQRHDMTYPLVGLKCLEASSFSAVLARLGWKMFFPLWWCSSYSARLKQTSCSLRGLLASAWFDWKRLETCLPVWVSKKPCKELFEGVRFGNASVCRFSGQSIRKKCGWHVTSQAVADGWSMLDSCLKQTGALWIHVNSIHAHR